MTPRRPAHPPLDLSSWTKAGVLAALIGGVVATLGWFSIRHVFYQAYLTAYCFWLNVTLGCLGLAMLHGLTGGGWGIAIRRVIESGYQTLPLMAVLFLPLWFGASEIYPWTHSEFVQHHESVAKKLGYLNLDAWQTRAAVIFGVWLVITVLLDRSSPLADTKPDSPRSRRLQQYSGLGFIAYALTLTIASVDWVMSLEPTWYSTMYGVLYMGAQAVTGMAFAIVVVTLLGQHEPWRQSVTPERRHDLGNLLMAFVLFWNYVHFMQFLIIWSGNLPEENVWYLHRGTSRWLTVVWILAIFHFAAPFLLLLQRRNKRQPERLAKIAGMLLVMQALSIVWLIWPAFDGEPPPVNAPSTVASQVIQPAVLTLAAWLAIGGLWIVMFAWRLQARGQLPIYDPPPEGVAHG